jgi:hypothetical protein
MELHSRVKFHPLLIRPEGEEWMVGRIETNSFIYLPQPGVAVIEWLQQGMTLEAAGNRFEAEFGEKLDIIDLVSSLNEMGFIEWSGVGEPPAAPLTQAAPAATQPEGHFANISQQTAARFFTRPLLWFYGIFIAGGLLLLAVNRSYWPRSVDMYWHPWLTITLGSLLLVNIGHVFLHEMAHLLAARARGIPSRMGLSRRLLSLVAITDISGIYAVPQPQRYLIYGAGMLWDALVASVCVYLMALSEMGVLPLPALMVAFLKAVLVNTALLLVWQIQLHLRTDIYFLAANWLKTRNLQADALGLLSNLWDRLRGKAPGYDLSGLPRRELLIVRIYAPLLVGLLLFYWYSFGVLTLPYLIKTVPVAINQIAHGFSDPLWFGDGLMFLSIQALNYGLLLYVMIRDWSAGRRRSSQQAAAGGNAA